MTTLTDREGYGPTTSTSNGCSARRLFPCFEPVLGDGEGGTATALAATGQADPNGPQAFYFGADCTGIGSVVLVNTGPSRTASLQVLDQRTIVLVPVNGAIEDRALAAGTTCTFMSHGTDPSDLEPNEEPETVPVVIVNG